MAYRVVIPKSVQKDLASLPRSVRERIIESIRSLGLDPRPYGAIKLKGATNEYRIRVGNYRIRYEIHDEELIVIILYAVHRKDAYKD